MVETPRSGRPFAGAWIETRRRAFSAETRSVAPSRGRGLKQQSVDAVKYLFESPLRGGVD